MNNGRPDTYSEVLESALDSLRERLEYERDNNEVTSVDDLDLYDVIHECADSGVPVYTYDRFSVLASDMNVANRDLELAEGVTNLTQLAGIAIYEALAEDLAAEADEIAHSVFVTSVLEYLRSQLRAECISYGELATLQGMADEIDPDDLELLEAAGVPETDDDDPDAGEGEIDPDDTFGEKIRKQDEDGEVPE